MKCAAKSLKTSFSKMVHLTCLAHGLHRIAETVRLSYPEVDSLIANVKKVFLKAPNRVQKFLELYPKLSLPPKPILTRWGTWLECVEYYKNNIEKIKFVISTFNPEDALSIGIAKECLESSKINQQLVYIHSNFSSIKTTITELESNKLSLNESLEKIEKVSQALSNANGSLGKVVFGKLQNVLLKNTGFNTMCNIRKILNGEDVPMDVFVEEFTAQDLTFFKFAPTTSCEVERSFSVYKSILAGNQKRFDFVNLKHHFVTHCNANFLK